MEFQEISRDCINGRLGDNSAIYKDVPASHNKNNVSAKAIYLTVEKKYAPYLSCGYCTKTFVWYNFSKGKWVNQSGMSSVKLHQETCSKNESKPSTSTQQPLIEHCFAAVKSTETRKPLPWKLKKLWRDEVVDQLSENPTVSINACANLASAHANYAAGVTIRANTLYNWNIGRTYITEGIQEKGTSAHLQLKQLYLLFSHSEAADTCVSGIMDFWSGRHQQRVGYGGIIACGLTDEWKWFQFPLRLENLDEVPHDSEFTFKIFDEAFCSDVKARYPFFVTTDNENKMKAAFDGRWETADRNFGGRIGCTEHAMSTCLTNVLDAEPKGHCRLELRDQLMDKINNIESFYNRRDDRAKKLVRAIPGKSTTRPWRSHYNRFLAAVHNYVVYLKEDDNSVVDNLPSLALLKSVLAVMEQVKLFFDRVEVDGVTSHLSFVNYLLLDMFLFDRQMDESEHGVTRNLCQDLRGQMEQKLWMYSGSPFSQSAAFLSGLDIPKTIRGYVKQHSRSTQSVHKTFAKNWLKVAAEHDTIVDQYLEQLFGMCEPSVKPLDPYGIKKVHHQKSGDPFQDLYLLTVDDDDEGEQPLAKRPKATTLGIELQEFKDTRVPMKDPTQFWRYSVLTRLRTCAKIIFSAPISSAAVERLFSQAGNLLSKMRKRMSPAVMKKLIYIRYQKKYITIIKKLGIVIEPEEVAKVINNEPMSLSFEDDSDIEEFIN